MASLDVADGVTEVRIRPIGDSETAFCFGGRGSETDLPIGTGVGGPVAWFSHTTFYGVPDGYFNVLGSTLIPASGNGRDGFTSNGVGADELIKRLPSAVAVHKADYALGGTTAAGWANHIPDWRSDPTAAKNPASNDYWGYRSAETGLSFAAQIVADVAAGHRPVVPFTLGGNDVLNDTNHSGGRLMSDASGWATKFSDYYDDLEAIVEYIHFLAGGDPDNDVPGNVEVVLMSYPNFNVGGNEEITEYLPQTDIDGSVPGARRALACTDQMGFYREFYYDAVEQATPVVIDGTHNYRVGNPSGQSWDAGPVPLSAQLDRTRTPSAQHQMADCWYLDRAAPIDWAFQPIDPGDAVNRGYNAWTINAWSAVSPPFGSLLSGATWTYDSLYGPHGSTEADYAPEVINGWHIASRNVHETSVNALMHNIGAQMAAIDTDFTDRFGDESSVQYVDMWAFAADPDRDDVAAPYRPWPVDLWFDLIHLNKRGAEIWTGGVWDSMAARSSVIEERPVWKVELGLSRTDDNFIIGSSLLGPSSDPLDSQGSYEWTDISEHVDQTSLSTSRGATRSQGPWWRCEAGAASFTIDDRDGDFDPQNLSSSYVSGGVNPFRPGIGVRIIRTGDDFERVVWSGTVDTWESRQTGGSKLSSVAVTAIDAVEALQAARPTPAPSGVGAGDTVAERINRILDLIQWDANARDIGDGDDATMQATTLSASALEEIQLTADSAGGHLWVTPEGKVTYRPRRSMPRSAELLIADDIEEFTPTHHAVNTSFDRRQIYNSVTIARVGGREITQVNDYSTSIADHGIRSYARTDLICETDAQAADIAGWIQFQFGDIEHRVESIEATILGSHSDAVWLGSLDADIGRRAEIRYTSPDGRIVTHDGIVRGVSWRSLLGGSAGIVLTFQSTPTDPDEAFVVGESLLGSDKVLAPY